MSDADASEEIASLLLAGSRERALMMATLLQRDALSNGHPDRAELWSYVLHAIARRWAH